jgi:hypothetical protein
MHIPKQDSAHFGQLQIKKKKNVVENKFPWMHLKTSRFPNERKHKQL